MAWTFDEALDDPDLTVIVKDEEAGNWIVRIGILTTPVSIHIRRRLKGPTVDYWTSHAIKAGTQGAPYVSSREHDTDAAYSLHRAVEGFTSYYRDAVSAGYKPEETWLVPRNLG